MGFPEVDAAMATARVQLELHVSLQYVAVLDQVLIRMLHLKTGGGHLVTVNSWKFGPPKYLGHYYHFAKNNFNLGLRCLLLCSNI